MSGALSITCSAYIDYSSRRNCPMYNIDDCTTPEAPILCPMIENNPRSPCTRFICSSESLATTASTVVTTDRSTSNVISEIVGGVTSAYTGNPGDLPPASASQVYF